MTWINGVGWDGGRLAPIAIDEHGAAAATTLGQLRVNLPPKGYVLTKVSGLPLHSLERVEASEYLSEFGLEHADPLGHEIFCFYLEGKRALVPAGVLLHAVLTRRSEYVDKLLDAASLDSLAHPSIRGQAVTVQFRKGAIPKMANNRELQGLFTWLTCFASARRFWASIYLAGRDGILGCKLPQAAVDATLWGHCSATTVFVTRIGIKSLTPLEPPLPFAAGKVPLMFKFSVARTKTASAQLRKYRSTNTYRAPAQDDIPPGVDGWKTTTEEWRSIVATLKAQGFVCKLSSKASVDMALEKQGSGGLWGEESSQMTTAQSTYSHWNKNGKWDALKSALRDLRRQTGTLTSSLGSSPPAAQELIPAGHLGWKTSDQEWLAIMDAMSSKGFSCRERSKANIDLVLEKLGSARPWREVAPGNTAPPTLYSLWNRNGRWDALIDALHELRTDTNEVC